MNQATEEDLKKLQEFLTENKLELRSEAITTYPDGIAKTITNIFLVKKEEKKEEAKEEVK